MKWLIINDNQSIQDEIEKTITEADKKAKFITSSFDIEKLKKQKKSFNDIAGAIIYSARPELFSSPKIALLSSLSGYLVAKEIALITNVEFVYNNPLLDKSFLYSVDSNTSICSFINKNYKIISAKAKKRIAKNKLLDRGIPFTSDCFATYIAKNKMEIFNEFLEAGMEVNCRDDLGTPMLNIACRNDNFEFVEVLLGLGAELNAISEDRGYTAVMDAVWRGNEKITRYLIEKGAELNTINKEGQTNLVLAVGANRENIVKLLAENGADPDVKDMMGMSAYNYATLFKKQRLVDILKPYHKE